jgi:hypothetical protein
LYCHGARRAYPNIATYIVLYPTRALDVGHTLLHKLLVGAASAQVDCLAIAHGRYYIVVVPAQRDIKIRRNPVVARRVLVCTLSIYGLVAVLIIKCQTARHDAKIIEGRALLWPT